MAKILVIDDSPTVAAFVGRALTPDGHVVEEISSFVDLLPCLASFQPDLILLDLSMPALSGDVLGRFVRRLEKRRTAIVVYSSLGDAEMRAAAAEVRAEARLGKDASPEELRNTVRRVLGTVAGAEAGAANG